MKMSLPQLAIIFKRILRYAQLMKGRLLLRGVYDIETGMVAACDGNARALFRWPVIRI